MGDVGQVMGRWERGNVGCANWRMTCGGIGSLQYINIELAPSHNGPLMAYHKYSNLT